MNKFAQSFVVVAGFFFINQAIARSPITEIERELHGVINQQTDLQLRDKAYQPKKAISAQGEYDTQCLPYQRIVLQGIHLIDATQFDSLLQGHCINDQQLNTLSKSIVRAYLDQGYIHTPIQFQPQGQDLYVNVTESKVAGIQNDNGRLINTGTLFPNMVGKHLNVRDLDQGLDQANRLLANHLTVDVLPQEDGDLQLKLVNEAKAPVAVGFGVDNKGDYTTGHTRLRGWFNWDSPLGLSDNLYVGLISSVSGHTSQKYNRSALLMYSVPYGYWTFSVVGAYSRYKAPIELVYNQAEQTGDSWFVNLKAERVVSRGENHITTLYGQYSRLSSGNYFMGEYIKQQSPELSTLQAGVNHLQLIPNGFITLDLSYERGLRVLGGDRNQDGLPRPEFNKYQLSGLYLQNHTIGNVPIRHTHQLFAQYSSKSLPSVKQMPLLDLSYVRGFTDRYADGEAGFALQNTLSFPLHQGQWTIEPRVGVDVGQVTYKETCTSHCRTSVISYSVGVKASYQNLDLDLQYAKGRYMHDDMPDLASRHSRNSSLLFSVDYRF